MKRFLPILLCLLLMGCTPQTAADPEEGTPAVPPAPVEDHTEETPQEPQDPPQLLDRLAVELVVTPEDAERIMPSLRQLSSDLGDALEEAGWDVEQISFSLGTAGGITGDALADGGVDLAILPVMDYLAREDMLFPVLLSGNTEEAWMVALSQKEDILIGPFAEDLTGVLLYTEAGQSLLNTWSPEQSFVVPADDVMDALREACAEDSQPSDLS